MKKRNILISELIKHIKECNKKIDLAISNINDFGNELEELFYKTFLDNEIDWRRIKTYTYEERKAMLDYFIKKILEPNDFVENVEQKFKNSNIKFYLNECIKQYAKGYYNSWKYANNLHTKFFDDVKKKALIMTNSSNPDLAIGKWFQFTYEMLELAKNKDEKHYLYSLFATWILGFIAMLIAFDEDFEYIKKNYINELEINLIKIEGFVFNEKYIDKNVFKDLKNFAEYYNILGMGNEYSVLMKLVGDYKNTFKDKKEKYTQVSSTLETSKNVTSNIALPTREERIMSYNEAKTKSVYVDDSIGLSSEQIDVIIQYVRMVRENASTDANTLLELLPYDSFTDEMLMLKEIVDRLKKVNTTHNMNALLIILNNRLKEISKKAIMRKEKKNKKKL